MNGNGIASVQQAIGTTSSSPVSKLESRADAGFGGLFHSAAAQVNKLETDAQTAVTGLLTGQGVEVHDAMIATQRSELAFQLALQVRNKAVAAYQQMMQMQF